MTTKILICLLAWFATSVKAHDPYEITSTAYVRSDQIELLIEMEFPAGMKLAGLNPAPDVAAVSQFESALPRLRALAGGFFQLTAGNNAVAVLSTNVELGVEDHIRFRLEYAATPHRPLQFTARGLGASSDDNRYGTSLTVLDMVNQKVLGQTTLFAGRPNSEFPPVPQTNAASLTRSELTSTSAMTSANSASQVSNTDPLTQKIPIEPKTQPNLALLLTLLVAGLIFAFALSRRRKLNRKL